jgi:predicted DNA-binding protein
MALNVQEGTEQDKYFVSTHIDAETKRRLDEIRKEQDRSLSSLLRILIRLGLDQMEAKR